MGWEQISGVGVYVKSGEQTIFDAQTLTEAVQNFKASAYPLMLDHNHDSLVGDGRPAIALGWFTALAAVVDGKIVAAHEHDAAVPDLDATTVDDGLWGWLAPEQITPIGRKLLAGGQLRRLSPGFIPDSLDDRGRPIGMELLSVGACNNPHQWGLKELEVGFSRGPAKRTATDGVRVVTFARGVINLKTKPAHRPKGSPMFTREHYLFNGAKFSIDAKHRAYAKEGGSPETKFQQRQRGMIAAAKASPGLYAPHFEAAQARTFSTAVEYRRAVVYGRVFTTEDMGRTDYHAPSERRQDDRVKAQADQESAVEQFKAMLVRCGMDPSRAGAIAAATILKVKVKMTDQERSIVSKAQTGSSMESDPPPNPRRTKEVDLPGVGGEGAGRWAVPLSPNGRRK
jgi:hypothetical protein